jgi:hypothetical protein
MEIDKLTHLSKEYLIAKERYERAVRILIRTKPKEKNTLFQKTTFWTMLDDLGSFVKNNVRKRDDPVRYGIEQWMKKVQDKGAEGYTFDDLPDFIRTYGKLKESIAKSMRGSDLFDLVDSVPLTGKQPCLRIISGEFEDIEQLREALHAICDDTFVDHGVFIDHIMTRENHVEQWLEQAYANTLCEALALRDHDFLLELENADP